MCTPRMKYHRKTNGFSWYENYASAVVFWLSPLKAGRVEGTSQRS